MLDLKESLGVVTASLVVVTTIFGLLSAWIGYKVKVRDAAVWVERRSQVVGIDDPTIHTKHWNVDHIKWFLVSFNLLLLVLLLGISAVRIGFDRSSAHYFAVLPYVIALAMLPVFSCALVLFMFKFIRTAPPSRTMKTVRVVLAEKVPDALQDALAAVQSIGVQVARLDPEDRVIEGRIPMSFWKNPALVRVVVRKKGDEQSEIEISSDSTLPSVVFDFGMNARNVHRIMSYLLGSQRKQ